MMIEDAPSHPAVRMTDSDWFSRVPKIELHLHLEGAIPYAALWELVRKYGGDPTVPTLDALVERFQFRDFTHFIEAWVWKNRFLREYDDFTFIAEAVARDLQAQNIRYAETFYSPPDFARHGLEPQSLTQAICAGLAHVPDVEIALVADLVRDDGPDNAGLVLQQVNEVRDLGVVGIGIGGSEARYPPEPFAEVYATARRLGFRTSAHAGEAAGAASIWGAIRALGADRIGHGTRAAEDPDLLDHLAARQIPLEMCPISNLRTGIVRSLAEHPIRRYFDHGILVTVNTDDPKMFGNSLADEYRALEMELGFSRDQIRRVILNAIEASWLPEDRKAPLKHDLMTDPSWNDATCGAIV
jgi:adenosine deaminase